MARYHKFDTIEALVATLMQSGFRQDDNGEWWRASWHAIVSQQKNGVWRYEVV
jgi:hypothetical protein